MCELTYIYQKTSTNLSYFLLTEVSFLLLIGEVLTSFGVKKGVGYIHIHNQNNIYR